MFCKDTKERYTVACCYMNLVRAVGKFLRDYAKHMFIEASVDRRFSQTYTSVARSVDSIVQDKFDICLFT